MAHIGFVSWGSTQGAVREALECCRKFGMSASAIYPKFLYPFPTEELKSFASTVKQFVVVELNNSGNWGRLIREKTTLRPVQIFQEPGTHINPMDIFLKEGFQGHFS